MDLLRHKDIGFLLCLAVVLLVAFSPIGHRLDNTLFDLWPFEQAESNSDIIVVEIDNKSLSALGRWPWERHLHAEMIHLLDQAEANQIGYNVAFVEPDTSPNSEDHLLLTAIRSSGNVVLPVFAEDGKTIMPFRNNTVPEGARLGHVDVEVDSDGYVRRAFLYAGIDKARWPSFGLATAGSLETLGQEGRLPGTRSPEAHMGTKRKWTRDHEVLMPAFTGPIGIQRYSFIDVLESHIDHEIFRGKDVFVGIQATGLEPKFLTPGTQYPEMYSGTSLAAGLHMSLKSRHILTPILPIWGLTYALVILILGYAAIFLTGYPLLIRAPIVLTLIGTLSVPAFAIHFGYWLPTGPAAAAIIAMVTLYFLKTLFFNDTRKRSDAITDLSNAKMFKETLEIEWEQCLIKRIPVSVILIEVDYFKRFVDTFGEERGNWVLARIGPILQSHKRKTRDLVARYEHEKFAVLLPITPNNVALSIAEKMRAEVEQLDIEHGGSESSDVITLSVGVATSTRTMETKEDLIEQAKAALAHAKQSGGNNVVQAEPETT